ncbi:MAG: hypothetical protein ACFNL3_09155, partial [Rothia aeria]
VFWYAIASGVIYQRTAPQHYRSNHDKIAPMSETENAPYAPSAPAAHYGGGGGCGCTALRSYERLRGG